MYVCMYVCMYVYCGNRHRKYNNTLDEKHLFALTLWKKQLKTFRSFVCQKTRHRGI